VITEGAMTTVGEAMADSFIRHGVTTVFHVMGEANMRWLVEMRKRGSRLYHARHEAAAVAMADGYAQTSGHIGIASVTCGPGLTQTATSLITAARGGIPLVIVAGDVPSSNTTRSQRMDQRAFATACECAFVPVEAGFDVAGAVDRAFQIAAEGRPVVLNSPWDIVEQPNPAPRAQGFPMTNAPMPDGELAGVAEVTWLLSRSERPLIVIGGGALDPLALKGAAGLSRRIGAPTATTLAATAALHEDPFAAGIVGYFATPVLEKLARESDVVLGIGTRLDGQHSSMPFPEAEVVAINVSQARTINLQINADPRSAVAGVSAGLLAERKTGRRTRLLAEALDQERNPVYPRAPSGTIDPRDAVRGLQTYLTGVPRSNVVIGIAHFWAFPVMYLRPTPRPHFVFTHHFGAIGQALPTGIGAALATPERLTVVFEGDASFLMHVQELESASRNRVKLLVAVLNNGAIASELYKLEAAGLPVADALMPTPRMDAIARACGGDGALVRSRRDLDRALERFRGQQQEAPFVLDIRIPLTAISQPYRRMFGERISGLAMSPQPM
jgi:acetolactate synthase I/II/III large subunit